jgi:uncharacterized protein
VPEAAPAQPLPQRVRHPHLAIVTDTVDRRRLGVELLIVLAIAFGASTFNSIITIVNRLTMDVALSQQTATITRSYDDRPLFDLAYQLVSILFGLMPVAIALYLIWRRERPHFAAIGLDRRRWGRDAWWGVALAAAIGIPGLAFYLLGRAMDITTTVVPTALDQHWWTVPVLVLVAVRAALLEELIVVGFLFARLRQLAWNAWAVILVSAVVRGSYHLYQGIGPFFGNVAMGILFGWLYQRYGRVLPLVVAHFMIDLVVFVGYPFAAGWWPGLFGLPTG